MKITTINPKGRYACIVLNEKEQSITYFNYRSESVARAKMKQLLHDNVNESYINITLFDYQEVKYLHDRKWGY